MNPNDYENDGNNIVPCPICLNVHCPSKYNLCYDCGKKLDGQNCSSGGVHDEPRKCPEEDEFVKSMNNTEEKKWVSTLVDMLREVLDTENVITKEWTDFVSKIEQESYARGVKDTVDRVRGILPDKEKTITLSGDPFERGENNGWNAYRSKVIMRLNNEFPSIQINNDNKEE